MLRYIRRNRFGSVFRGTVFRSDRRSSPYVRAIEERIETLTPKAGPYDLRVGVLGCGGQGRALATAAAKLRGIRIEAVCDLVRRRREELAALVGGRGRPAASYEHFGEMLDRHPDLNAVLLATPDWCHREHALAAMGAGAHVYCEAPMAHSTGEALEIADAAARLDRKVQIGLQRRSHPAYRVAIEEFGHEIGVYGELLQCAAHANHIEKPRDPVRTEEIPVDLLNRHGYGTPDHLLNWRWHRRYGSGPFVERGVHAIDIFNWAFGGAPSAVVSSGGADALPGVEHADNGMALFTYETGGHTRRALYCMNATSSHLGTREIVCGLQGAVRLCLEADLVAWPAEEAAKRTRLLPDMLRKAAIMGIEVPVVELERFAALNRLGGPSILVDSTPTIIYPRDGAAYVLDAWAIVAPRHIPPQHFHLVNFFDAVQFGTPLHCPPGVGIAATRAAFAAREALGAAEFVRMGDAASH